MKSDEIKTIVDDEQRLVRHYYLNKPNVPFDEILKMPKTVQREFCRTLSGDYESYCTIHIDKTGPKNIYVGLKEIKLQELGNNIVLKKNWIDQLIIKDGKVRGKLSDNRWTDEVIECLFKELGVFEELCTPLGVSSTDITDTKKLLTKSIIQKIVKGKIQTREQLLLEHLRTSYKILTVSAETYEAYRRNYHSVSLTLLKKNTKPEELEDAILEIIGNYDKESLIRDYMDIARDFKDIKIDVATDPHILFDQYESMLRQKAKLMEQYGLIKETDSTKYESIGCMQPITSEKEAFVIAHLFNTDEYILPSDNQISFRYNKETVIKINFATKDYRILTPRYRFCKQNKKEIEKDIERILRKNEHFFQDLLTEIKTQKEIAEQALLKAKEQNAQNTAAVQVEEDMPF